MAFGGGFGSNNNNNASSTFGGFGSSATGGGFGSNNNTSTGGSLFGGNTATSGGFGGGGFGSSTNNSNPFGAASKPAFGAAATTTGGGGLFGGTTNNTSTSGAFGGGGGFGSSTNNNTSGFGSNTGGGLFGQSKPATSGFGATNTGSSLFGGGAAAPNTGGFGANANAGSAFGANTNTSGFGAGTNTGGGFSFAGANNAAASNNNGTAGTPFQAFQEKDVQANQMQHFQSITFQQPYQNKSFEELRTEDYAQGRKFGNTNGQAGSFGQSTGFGGFGSSNANNANAGSGGGLFGSNTAASGNTTGQAGGFGQSQSTPFSGFGGNANATSAFGSQNKPATGGLFGSTATSGAATGGFGSTSTGGGGLFGSGGGGGGFGSNTANTNTNNTGGGLFGNNNNAAQNKPAFGGFGSATNTGGGFGSTTNTGGGGLFGASNTTQNTGGGLFGQNNQQQQQQQQSSGFGASTNNQSGGLFGNQNKPAQTGLFGSSTTANTGGGLFGAQQNQQQSGGGLFGSSTNNNAGGLFANQNQNKPAGTGLFGSTANTGSSLFGQNNQQSGSSLFGGNNANAGNSTFGAGQNKPAGTGLFGSTLNTSNTGGGLFGNNQQNQQGGGGSLFGASQNQNANQNNSSLFGGSFNGGGQQQPQQNQLHASLTGSPYGNEQLFSSLAAPSPPVGPLATPLQGAKAAARKTPSLLSSVRMSTPVYSPRGSSIGRAGGYGFSYSTYGTPGSAFTSGSLTPGASSLLRPTGSFGSALTNRLNKSFSTSNLRGDSVPGEGRSLMRPGPFSPDGTPGRYNTGSMRKLKIDRSLRSDLFGTAATPETKAIEPVKEPEASGLGKKVSFDNSKEKENAPPEASASNALVRTEDREELAAEPPVRVPPTTRSQSNGRAPEMEQVDKTLTTVPEDAETPRPSSAPGTKMPAEKNTRRNEVGDYWTRPAMKDLKKMSRQQLKNVGNFAVGRDGVGRIEFGSVDLTNTPLEDICGDIVQLNPRSATVYQDDRDKPSMGKALNVPSTIYLENSWPRSHGGKKTVIARSGKEYDKHIARLRRVGGTQFVSYSPDTGVWCFQVDHFTTYGLDDDDEDESEFPDDSRMHDELSGLSDAPASPEGEQDVVVDDPETPTGEMDDTFQFQLEKRSQLSLPGGFDSENVSHDFDDVFAQGEMNEDQSMDLGGFDQQETQNAFASAGGAVQAPSPGAIKRYHSSMIEDEDDDVPELGNSMPGTFIAEPLMPRSILKPSTAMSILASPEKLATESWEEQLQRTMSPKKRDRQALRDMQQSFLAAKTDDLFESPLKQSMLGRSALGQSYLAQKSANEASVGRTVGKELGKSQAFRTAMDLMDSLYGPERPAAKTKASEV